MNTLSDTDAAWVATNLSLCFKTKSNLCWTTAWHTQSPQYTQEYLVREKKLQEPVITILFFAVDCPLF